MDVPRAARSERYDTLGCEGRVVPGPSGSLTTWCPRPFAVPGATGLHELAVGGEVVFATRDDGSVLAWDSSLSARIQPMARHTPEDALPIDRVSSADGVSGIAASSRLACGRRADTLVCFGHPRLGYGDSHGELGTGTVGELLSGGAIVTIAMPNPRGSPPAQTR